MHESRGYGFPLVPKAQTTFIARHDCLFLKQVTISIKWTSML